MHKDFQKIVKIIIKIYVFYGFLCLLHEKKIINIDNIINSNKNFNFFTIIIIELITKIK